MLASQPGMSLVQAQAILSSAPQQTTEAAVSVPERIMSLDEAVGREPLAQALAATPGMTLEQAKSLLALSPKAASLSDSIMALEETSGREELAQQLSSVPGMTLEQARVYCRLRHYLHPATAVLLQVISNSLCSNIRLIRFRPGQTTAPLQKARCSA